MAKTVVVCGKLFDGLNDTIRGPSEILIEDDAIAERRPIGAEDLVEMHFMQRSCLLCRSHAHHLLNLRLIAFRAGSPYVHTVIAVSIASAA